jgi:hypothetical protein
MKWPEYGTEYSTPSISSYMLSCVLFLVIVCRSIHKSLISLLLQIYYHTTNVVMQLLNTVDYIVKFDSSYDFGFVCVVAGNIPFPRYSSYPDMASNWQRNNVIILNIYISDETHLPVTIIVIIYGQ